MWFWIWDLFLWLNLFLIIVFFFRFSTIFDWLYRKYITYMLLLRVHIVFCWFYIQIRNSWNPNMLLSCKCFYLLSLSLLFILTRNYWFQVFIVSCYFVDEISTIFRFYLKCDSFWLIFNSRCINFSFHITFYL